MTTTTVAEHPKKYVVALYDFEEFKKHPITNNYTELWMPNDEGNYKITSSSIGNEGGAAALIRFQQSRR